MAPRLVGDEPDGVAGDPGQGGDQLRRPGRLAARAARRRRRWPRPRRGRRRSRSAVEREQLPQLRCRPVGRVTCPGRIDGRGGVGVVRQVGDQLGHQLLEPRRRRRPSGRPRRSSGRGPPAPPSWVGLTRKPGHLGHRRRARHVGDRVRGHHHHVGDAEQQGGPRQGRSDDGQDDGDHAGAGGHGPGRPAPAVEGADAVVDVDTARRQHADQGEALVEGGDGGGLPRWRCRSRRAPPAGGIPRPAPRPPSDRPPRSVPPGPRRCLRPGTAAPPHRSRPSRVAASRLTGSGRHPDGSRPRAIRKPRARSVLG